MFPIIIIQYHTSCPHIFLEPSFFVSYSKICWYFLTCTCTNKEVVYILIISSYTIVLLRTPCISKKFVVSIVGKS